MSLRESALGARPWILVGILAAFLHVVFSALTPSGHLTWDAGTYHLAVKAFLESGSFSIPNGFEEFPSPELVVGQLCSVNGTLVSQYPELFTLVAAPFYAVFGFRGFFVLNSLAFLGTCAVLFGIARRLFGCSELARLAVCIYALGTFAWEYSQWPYPHALGTLVVVLAFWIAMVAAARESAYVLHGLSGLVAGLGVGIRLDIVLVAPALLAVSFLAGGRRALRAVSGALGVAAGLLLPAAVNVAKFGSPNPFSYCTDPGLGYGAHESFLPLALLAVAIGVGAREVRRRSSLLLTLAFSVAALGAAVALAPSVMTAILRTLEGSFGIAVDLRARSTLFEEQEFARTSSGAVSYLGAVKKSLLQSLPYLGGVLALLLGARKEGGVRARLALVGLVPATYLVFFGYHGWHGSLALNMRYLTPTLPFFALSSAYALEELLSGAGRSPGSVLVDRKLVGVFCFVLVAGTLGLRLAPPPLAVAERLLLTLPLVLAVLFAAAGLFVVSGRAGAPFRRVLALALAASIGWAGAVGFGYDYPVTTAHQLRHHEVARALARHVPARSLVLSDHVDFLWGLLDRVDGVHLGRAEQDDFRTFRALLHAQRSKGRAVYLVYEERGGYPKLRRPPASREISTREVTRFGDGPHGAVLLLLVE